MQFCQFWKFVFSNFKMIAKSYEKLPFLKTGFLSSYKPYLLSLPDLSGVSRVKQFSPGFTILVYFLPVSTEPLLFFCLHLNR